MNKFFYTLGLQGSGKTTKALEMVAASNGKLKRVNRDELRLMIDGGKWSQKNEAFIIKARDLFIRTALASGYDVISDDTNLSPKVQADLRRIAMEEGATIEVIDLTDVPIETCIERDLKRAHSVGEKVIRETWQKYLYKEPTTYPRNSKLQSAIICDLDGTIAKMVDRGPFEWGKVYQDEPRHAVIDSVKGLHQQTGAKIIFVSGRDSVCREDTLRWLEDKSGFKGLAGGVFPLFMRPQGDMRKDYIIKEEIFNREIKDKYDIIAVFDDRPQVLALWRNLGLGDRLFNVGYGREF